MAATTSSSFSEEPAAVMRKRSFADGADVGKHVPKGSFERDISTGRASVDHKASTEGKPDNLRPYRGDWDNYKVEPRESSGVMFYPHPRYWLVGGKWYDLEPFLHRHPGGPR